jgi:hypothetical protein
VLSEYGRALAYCTMGAIWKLSGSSSTALATIRCRSSSRVGPNSSSSNWNSASMAMPLPLQDAVGWPPHDRELART